MYGRNAGGYGGYGYGVFDECIMFRKTIDYATYINQHGCDFGHFTCCRNVNNTILEEYASLNCGMSDVCGYDALAKLRYTVNGLVLN